MKKSFDFKKGAETWEDVKQKTSGIVQKTSEVGKQVASNVAGNVQKSVLDLAERSKNESYDRRMKK